MSATLGQPVDHLFVCQHSAKCLAPVDRHFIHIGKSFIVQLYEYPLCPFIILWIRCIYLSVPVIAETEFLDLTAEIIDIHLIEFRDVITCRSEERRVGKLPLFLL